MNRDQIVQALMFYAPTAKWEFSVESAAVDSAFGKILPFDIGYEHIVWNDLFYDKPTEEQLQELYDQSNEVYMSDTMYKTERQKAYPPVEEQLDMIFHQGIDVWKEKIQQIKDSIPKVGGNS
jgi:hypothetical protein